MEQPVGHVDFYPNGGTDQPGCSLMDLPINLTMSHVDRTADSVSRHLVACSHMRAVQLYIESLRLNQSCHMVGQECSTYEEYKMVGYVMLKVVNLHVIGITYSLACRAIASPAAKATSGARRWATAPLNTSPSLESMEGKTLSFIWTPERHRQLFAVRDRRKGLGWEPQLFTNAFLRPSDVDFGGS